MKSKSIPVLAVSATILFSGLALAAPARPNVVFFLIDDLGWADVGCYGSTFHETPNIDRLASEGMRFTNAYAASPVCSPTRASIMTGKYPARINFTRATPTESMPLAEVTLAEALKDAGYRTAHFGKWHLQIHHEKGKTHYPECQGFDVNVGGHSAGQPGSFFFPYKNKKRSSNDVPGLEDGKPGDYLTDVLTDKAIQFMQETVDKPFFLNMWYYTVHTPVTGKKDKIAKYEKKLADMGISEPAGADKEYESWNRKRQDNPVYAAMVESMDENVGRILEYLKSSGRDKDTVVIFMSDNGGLSTNSKSSKGGPTSNLPLRAGKAWVYEGGIREPMIVKWPGVTAKGRVCDVPIISTDFYPTILDMAGLPLKPKQHLDGLSLTGLLRGQTKELERKALYFHFPHDHAVNNMGASGAIRAGDHKLVERFSNGKVELYNLRDDLGEQTDLSQAQPALTAKLRRMLHDWRTATAATMPAASAPSVEPVEQKTGESPKRPEPREVTRAVTVKDRPDVENKPITISCRATPGKGTDGVLVVQGGKSYGYSVYVQDGKPCFSMRDKQKLTTIVGSTPVPRKPFELTAILGQGGKMSLLMDGAEAASGSSGTLITTQPGMGFVIGSASRAPVGPYSAPFAYPGRIAEVIVNGANMATEFFTPKQDMDGLKTAQTLNPDLPNVLLIGDSISVGYTKPTIELLKGVANVKRAPTNCGDTERGLRSLKQWSGKTEWDVIHFNWGLHDLCYRHPESKVQGRRDKVNGTIAVPLAQYERNLEQLVEQLKKTGAKLIWASTTVVPEGEAGRVLGDDIKYNAAAKRIMDRHGIVINDLHALTATFGPALFSGPGNVHFTKDGSAKLAAQVAEAIRANLPGAKATPRDRQ